MRKVIIISFLLFVRFNGFGQESTEDFLDKYGLYVKMKYPCKLLEYKETVNVTINVDSTCNVIKISQNPTLENKCDGIIKDALEILEKDLKNKFNNQCSFVNGHIVTFKFPDEY